MMAFNSCDALIYQALCNDDKISIYNVHVKTKITLADIMNSIDRLKKENLLYVKNEEIYRHSEFQRNAIRIRWGIVNRSKQWKNWGIDLHGDAG